MKRFQIVIVISLSYLNIYAQRAIEPLKIGDKVPDVILRNMRNYKRATGRLSDFKGKFIILDFWNKGCAPCIAGFPNLEKIQRQFTPDLQVLLVTNNKPSDIYPLFIKSPTIRSTQLPFVIGDSILYQLFQHSAEPFQVWIDDKGIVKMKTSGFNVTAENISALIDGRQLSVTEQNEILDWDSKEAYKSILQEGNGRQLKYLQFSSIILNRLPGILSTVSGISIDSISKAIIGFKMINLPVLDLFVEAFSFHGKGGSLRTVLEIPNAASFIQPMDKSLLEEWKNRNMFCYESRVKSAINWNCSHEERMYRLREMMKRDLESYFEIKGSIEKKLMSCWVLIQTMNGEKFRTKGGEEIFERPKGGYVFRNVSIETLRYSIELINSSANRRPVLNESGYRGNIDMDISKELDDIPSLRGDLNKYGLDLVEMEKEVEVLVLRKLKSN